MNQKQDDPVWTAAWTWLRREHDADAFDADARAELMAWLLADPAHRKAYDKAARLWLLSGLVPAATDMDDWKRNTPGEGG